MPLPGWSLPDHIGSSGWIIWSSVPYPLQALCCEDVHICIPPLAPVSKAALGKVSVCRKLTSGTENLFKCPSCFYHFLQEETCTSRPSLVGKLWFLVEKLTWSSEIWCFNKIHETQHVSLWCSFLTGVGCFMTDCSQFDFLGLHY